jgi:hypothetical protein
MPFLQFQSETALSFSQRKNYTVLAEYYLFEKGNNNLSWGFIRNGGKPTC